MPLHAWRQHNTTFRTVGGAARAEVFRMCLDVREVASTCMQQHFEPPEK
jgi:hypothetical protein